MNQTESVFDFTMTEAEALPVGQYIGILKDVQKTFHEQWGDGVMFVFDIVAGEHKGQTATRIVKPKPTTQNATGKLLSGITGKQYRQDEMINIRPFIGLPYNILIESTQGGKTRIAAVWKYNREQQTMPTNNYNLPPNQGRMANTRPPQTAPIAVELNDIPF